MNTLHDALHSFTDRAAQTPAVLRLIQRWDRTIQITDTTHDRHFTLQTAGGALLPPRSAPPASDPDILVAAEHGVLLDVFSGQLNPARANLDGDLDVVGSQRDHLVLDGVVMLIWGY